MNGILQAITGVEFSRKAATGSNIRDTGNYGWRTCPRSLYVAAIGGVEPTTFRTEGTDNLNLTNHVPYVSR